MNVRYFKIIMLAVALCLGIEGSFSQISQGKPEKKSQTETTKGTTTTKQQSTPTQKTEPPTSNKGTNTSQTAQSTHQTQIVSPPPNGYIRGYEYVDLGLSVKWAIRNVGAALPSDYGNYYAWGETRTKSEYTEDNSTTYFTTMESIAGNPTYDVATAEWGSPWRLPTKEEIEELVTKCSHKWTTQGGHNGYEFIGPNGNSIFFPAAGWRYESSLNYVGEDGYYWSATPYEDPIPIGAYFLVFDSSGVESNCRLRYMGRSVRPVSE